MLMCRDYIIWESQYNRALWAAYFIVEPGHNIKTNPIIFQEFHEK